MAEERERGGVGDSIIIEQLLITVVLLEVLVLVVTGQ